MVAVEEPVEELRPADRAPVQRAQRDRVHPEVPGVRGRGAPAAPAGQRAIGSPAGLTMLLHGYPVLLKRAVRARIHRLDPAMAAMNGAASTSSHAKYAAILLTLNATERSGVISEVASDGEAGRKGGRCPKRS